MKTTSVRELHIHTSALIREASGGETIVIQSRGEPVAELRPLTRKPAKRKLPDMTRFWAFPKVSSDSGRFLEEDR
jgi:antitoxin (DNA-binding transcriptional repressor) of toxin-antitoxin stability system